MDQEPAPLTVDDDFIVRLAAVSGIEPEEILQMLNSIRDALNIFADQMKKLGEVLAPLIEDLREAGVLAAPQEIKTLPDKRQIVTSCPRHGILPPGGFCPRCARGQR